MVPGRSEKVFKAWLEGQSQQLRDGIETVEMDEFTGFETAAAEEVPHAVAVIDPFHVVALAGDALERCRQRIHQATYGHPGRSGFLSTGSAGPFAPALASSQIVNATA